MAEDIPVRIGVAPIPMYLKGVLGCSMFALVVCLILGGLSSSGVPSMLGTHILFGFAVFCAVVGIVTSEKIFNQSKTVMILSGFLTLFIVGGGLFMLDRYLQKQRDHLDALTTPAIPRAPKPPSIAFLSTPKALPRIINRVSGNNNVTGNVQQGAKNTIVGSQTCPNGVCAGGDILGNPSVTNNYNAEPTERKFTPDQTTAVVQKLSTIPAPFWMITGSDIHGYEGKIRESADEQGAFELQLENLLIAANWEDFMITACKDPRGLFHADQPNPDGNIPLLRGPGENGIIDASLFNGPAGCIFPAYEQPSHGVLIEAPIELMDAAKLLNAELTKAMFRSSVRRADILTRNGKRVECIFIHVGTS